MPHSTVRFSDHALDAMLLAATEAYCLGVPQKTPRGRRKAPVSVEVDGYLWGYRTTKPGGDTSIFVDRFGPSVSSEKASGWVRPAEGSARLMNAIMERRAPQMTFLGTFHTHPYRSIKKVESVNGWQFSDGDRKCWSELDTGTDFADVYGDDAALWLVIAVARLQKVHMKVMAEQLRPNIPNIWKFDVGDMRFWVNAELVRPDEEGVAESQGGVVLDMDPAFLNWTGDRITST